MENSSVEIAPADSSKTSETPCTSVSQNSFTSSHTASTQSHSSMSQNVFSGRGSSLCANPFSVSSNSSQPSGILAKPKFSLKPPTLNATGDSNASSVASNNPAVVSSTNPFLRPAKLSYETNNDSLDKKTNDVKSAPDETSNESDEKGASNDEPKEEVDKDSDAEASQKSDNALPANSTAELCASSRAAQSFIFGEGLDSRVMNVVKENGSNGISDSEEKPKVLTLEEAATEYKKQQESGPTLPQVEVVTGEEGESNVLQISCKLFLFNNVEKSWTEKGRGLLRLNDCDEENHSRIVMRTSGIHRVMLNTSIWHSMICEMANHKSVRITGMENGEVHVYLLTGSPSDMEHLYSAVTYRVKRLKPPTSNTPVKSAPDVKATTGVKATADVASVKKEQTNNEVKSEEKVSSAEGVAETNDTSATKRKTEALDDKEASPKKLKTDTAAVLPESLSN